MSDNETAAPRRRGRPPKNREAAPEIRDEVPLELSNGPERRPMRDPLRDEDPRAAAERRAREIMGHIGDADAGNDEFWIDPSAIPDGWTYEWKRHSVLGAIDHTYMTHLRRTGWEEVPASRHPEMMPKGNYAHIERKGMILMQRPAMITEEFRRRDLREARERVRVREQQLASAPEGQFGREHSQVRPKINKGYEPMPIPDDK